MSTATSPAARLLGLLPVLALLACNSISTPAEARSVDTRYRAVNETPFGKAFSALRKDAPSVEKAIELTLADAARYFGAKPVVKSAYQDAKTGRSGGATFTIDANGTALKGLISCEVGKPGTTVAVVVIRADAPAGEWERLVNPEAAPRHARRAERQEGERDSESSSSDAAPKVANEPLERHVFEDNTASIGLARGWTTPSREAMKGVQIIGPEGQQMLIGVMASAQIPGSSLAGMPGSFVARYSTPLEALRTLAPQFSRQSGQNGGPVWKLDKLTQVSNQKPTMPNGRSSVLSYGVTERGRDGATKHYKVVAQVEISPISAQAFMISLTALRAPDAIFQRDLPVMLQMVQSLQSNDGEINRRSASNLAAQRDWFNNQQAGVRAQQAANDAQHEGYWKTQRDNAQKNKNWEAGQLAQARTNDNFSEAIRGVRTVEDTTTGERKSMNYLNVDKIVDDLNERDPGRYKQIPLRDEMHPLDGQ